MNRRYLVSARSEGANVLKSTESAVEYLSPLFAYATDEIAFALSVNSAGRVIRCHELARGVSNRVDFSARQVVEIAIHDNAAYILLAHNHISDVALPSKADVETTLQLKQTLEPLEIAVIDHIVVADNDFVSMADNGFI